MKVDEPATCTTKGAGHKNCTVCTLVAESNIEIPVDPNAHKWETEYTVDTVATCGAAGSKSIHCEFCDTKKDDSVTEIAATGAHKWDNGVITTQPTTSKEGVKTFTCSVCSATKTEKVAKKAPAVNFTDVRSNDFFYTPVQWAVENGVTTGTSATTFGPGENCTRGQIVTFLYRALAK